MKKKAISLALGIISATAIISSYMLYKPTKVREEPPVIQQAEPAYKNNPSRNNYKKNHEKNIKNPKKLEDLVKTDIKHFKKEQSQIYDELYPVFLECYQKNNYSEFIGKLNKIKVKPSYISGVSILAPDTPTGELMDAFISENPDIFLKTALTEGYFDAASIIADRLNLPEEITKALYEKWNALKGSDDAKPPYSSNEIKLLGKNIWLNYFNIALGNARRDDEGKLPQYLRNIFTDIIHNYLEHLPFKYIKDTASQISLDTSSPEIQDSLIKALNKKALQNPENIQDLEEIITGYTLTRQDNSAQWYIDAYLDTLFQKELEKTYNEKTEPKYLHNQLNRLKPYLTEDKYNYFSRQIEELEKILKVNK